MTPPDHRDRSRRLTVCGMLVMLAGTASIGLGLLQLLLPWLTALLPGNSPPPGVRSVLAGSATSVLFGAAMMLAGRGSMRRRRWSRPVLLMIGWTWLLSGVVGTMLVRALLDDLVILATSEIERVPGGLPEALRWIVLGVTVAAGILAPALLIAVYQPRDVERTLAEADPAPPRDDAPQSVVALSSGLLLAAVLLLPMALLPAVPWFGRLVTGFPGTALTLVLAGLLGWLARATHRRRPAGFWATGVLFVSAGASLAWTFHRVQLADYYRALGYPERQVELLAGGEGGPEALIVWGSVAMTVLSLGYLAWIRRFFRGAGRQT